MLNNISMRRALREEFRVKRFLLNHNNPKTFVQFQFGYPRVYLVWCLVWALYYLASILASVPHIRDIYDVKFFILASNLGYVLLVVSTLAQLTMCMYVSVFRRDKDYDDCINITWYMKACWVIFNISNTLNVIISIGYWIFIYKGPAQLNFFIVQVHAVNLVYVFSNLAVTGVPVRLFHFWQPVIVGVAYSIFSVLYHVAGGRNHYDSPYIYPFLNWTKPGTAVAFCVGNALVGTPIIHCLFTFLHLVKCHVISSYGTKKEETHTQPM